MLTQHARATAYRVEEERQERITDLALRCDELQSDLASAIGEFLTGDHFRGSSAARKALAATLADQAHSYILRAWWESNGRDCSPDELWEACGVRMP